MEEQLAKKSGQNVVVKRVLVALNGANIGKEVPSENILSCRFLELVEEMIKRYK